MIRPLLLLLLWLPCGAALAHQAGVTDTSIEIGHSKLLLVYTVPDALLAKLGATTPARQETLARQAFSISNDGASCPLESVKPRPLPDIGSQQFGMLYACDHPLNALKFDYLPGVQSVPPHKNLVRLSIAGEKLSETFDASHRTLETPVGFMLKLWGKQLPPTDFKMKTDAQPVGQSFWRALARARDYFPMGVEHILSGPDHILFLVGLLLLPLTFRQLVALITAFTVAHSMTLALSVLDVVNLPVVFVESMIALSIVYVGLENIWELRHIDVHSDFLSPWRRRLMIAFGFGLVHGFGFSYILKEIGLGSELPAALVLFNLGVEAGQLMIVLPLFPLLHLALNRTLEFSVARSGSVVISVVGAYWFLQRVFG